MDNVMLVTGVIAVRMNNFSVHTGYLLSLSINQQIPLSLTQIFNNIIDMSCITLIATYSQSET